jgi:anti-repressor protein
MTHSNTYAIATVCKLINFPGGSKEFFKWLRDKRYLQINNEPYQKYVSKGWLILTAKQVHIKNVKQIKPVTRFTMTGIAGIQKVVTKEFPPCIPCGKVKKTNE